MFFVFRLSWPDLFLLFERGVDDLDHFRVFDDFDCWLGDSDEFR